ncbi:MAG: MerR family transcriptional regulator [Deltaproteobacteria bacterium]|nr:MerR family transcriptional regulator [Deltaproteobacteria bacterium]
MCLSTVMAMSVLYNNELISSKEVLERSEISRATLNNYIKMGIIPKPIVQSPKEGIKEIRKIGYFPQTVLDRIKMVKQLKKEGYSMEEIARRFIEKPIDENEEDRIKSKILFKDGMKDKRDNAEKIHNKELKLHIEEISYPAYLLNYNFEIEWINQIAEGKILKQNVRVIDSAELRNIFKLFFNWEFHSLIKNWKDVVAYHMSLAKIKFSKTWLPRLYKGMSKKEIQVLEKIYDETSIFPNQIIKDTNINLLMKDGSIERYRAYSIFFREGILFIYILNENL